MRYQTQSISPLIHKMYYTYFKTQQQEIIPLQITKNTISISSSNILYKSTLNSLKITNNYIIESFNNKSIISKINNLKVEFIKEDFNVFYFDDFWCVYSDGRVLHLETGKEFILPIDSNPNPNLDELDCVVVNGIIIFYILGIYISKNIKKFKKCFVSSFGTLFCLTNKIESYEVSEDLNLINSYDIPLNIPNVTCICVTSNLVCLYSPNKCILLNLETNKIEEIKIPKDDVREIIYSEQEDCLYFFGTSYHIHYLTNPTNLTTTKAKGFYFEKLKEISSEEIYIKHYEKIYSEFKTIKDEVFFILNDFSEDDEFKLIRIYCLLDRILESSEEIDHLWLCLVCVDRRLIDFDFREKFSFEKYYELLLVDESKSECNLEYEDRKVLSLDEVKKKKESKTGEKIEKLPVKRRNVFSDSTNLYEESEVGSKKKLQKDNYETSGLKIYPSLTNLTTIANDTPSLTKNNSSSGFNNQNTHKFTVPHQIPQVVKKTPAPKPYQEKKPQTIIKQSSVPLTSEVIRDSKTEPKRSHSTQSLNVKEKETEWNIFTPFKSLVSMFSPFVGKSNVDTRDGNNNEGVGKGDGKKRGRSVSRDTYRSVGKKEESELEEQDQESDEDNVEEGESEQERNGDGEHEVEIRKGENEEEEGIGENDEVNVEDEEDEEHMENAIIEYNEDRHIGNENESNAAEEEQEDSQASDEEGHRDESQESEEDYDENNHEEEKFDQVRNLRSKDTKQGYDEVDKFFNSSRNTSQNSTPARTQKQDKEKKKLKKSPAKSPKIEPKDGIPHETHFATPYNLRKKSRNETQTPSVSIKYSTTKKRMVTRSMKKK